MATKIAGERIPGRHREGMDMTKDSKDHEMQGLYLESLRAQCEKHHLVISLKQAATFIQGREEEIKMAAELADSVWRNLPMPTGGPMRIGYYFIHRRPTGGMRVAVEQVNYLVKMGHEVTVFYRTHESLEVLPDWIECNPSHVYKIPLQARLHEVIEDAPKVEVLVSTFWTQLWELMQCANVEVVYYEQGHENLYGDPILRTLQSPFELMIRLPIPIMAVSDSVNEALKKRGRQGIIVNPGISECFRPLDDCPSVGEAMAGDSVNDIRNSSSTKGQGYQHYPVPPFDRLLARGERRTRILLVGSPNLAFKGFETVLAALRHLKERGHDFEVVWISPNPEPDDSILPFHCSWVINPPQDTLAKVMRHSDLLISGSHYEAFSLPPLEAMASGVPVVATDSGGIREYARNGENCLLVPVKSPGSMVVAIEKVLESREFRAKLVKEGLKTASSFTWPRTTQGLECALSKLVSMRRSTGFAVHPYSRKS